MTRSITPAAVLALAAAAPSLAQLPTYGPLELRAHPGAAGMHTTASIPSGQRPLLNDAGDLAFHFDRGTDTAATGIWLNGGPISTTLQHDRPIVLSLAENGDLTWHGFARPTGGVWAPGLFRWTGPGLDELLPIPADGNVHSVSANASGAVAFSRTPSGSAYADLLRWDPVAGLSTIAPGGFLQSDAHQVVHNAAGQMAVVNNEAFPGPRGVRRYEPGGSFIVVSEPYPSPIAPLIDMNDLGQVAFIAATGHQLLRADGQTLTTLVDTLTTTLGLSTISTAVAPAINSAGWVAFRARSAQGVEGIYVTDGTSLRLVAAVGDMVMTTSGARAISTFGAYGLDMNAAGDVAFIADLQGIPSCVILARAGAACPTDWNGDTQVNSADIAAFLTAWLDSLNNSDLNADFDGNGTVNSSDISAFLAAWFQAVTDGC